LNLREKLINPKKLWDALTPFEKGLNNNNSVKWWKQERPALQKEMDALQTEMTTLQRKDVALQEEKAALQQKDAVLQKEKIIDLEIQLEKERGIS
jgi:predicted  nucleic acid-binding Zn-ribbon protein